MLDRVAIVGASSTGKTTLCDLLRTKLTCHEFVGETTRIVNSYGFPINEDGTDATQLAISSLHLINLLIPNPLIMDRCYLDLLAYSRFLHIDKSTYNFIEETWHSIKHHYTHFIYCPVEFISVDDGIRSVNEIWRQHIDMQIVNILQESKLSHLTVTGTPEERVEQVLKYIGNGR